MTTRNLLAVAVAVAALSLNATRAAVTDIPPPPVSFPRPMPGPEVKLDAAWQTLREWLQPKLSHTRPLVDWL